MKSLKITLSVLIAFFLFTIESVNAQTKHVDMHAVADHGILVCMPEGQTISGEWTYRISYHIGKDGKIEWMHWNVLNYELKNDLTGEEYILIDTGHDNINNFGSWDMWNNINAFNEGYNIWYDLPDGTFDLPETNPTEGTAVFSMFKLKTKAGADVAAGRTVAQLHINACGEQTADVLKSWFECY